MSLVHLGEGPADATRLGGKAAALHHLAWLGFPVPPGFTVTADDDLEDVPLLDAFDRLGARLVAVRSSGIAEDGEVHSFAGQHVSYLNVERHELVARILACRDSAHAERALDYRRRQEIDATFSIAVLVQAMLPADVSGVCFTRHPTDPAPGRMLVEAVWGLGEALVSGAVVPDTYVLDGGTVVSERRSVQQTKLGAPRDGGGVVELPVPAHLRRRAKLSADELATLARRGADLERLYGFPCDIEFAVAMGAQHILQCRPITTPVVR